jgi:hypothetical protein
MGAATNIAQALAWFAIEAVLITRLLRGSWRRFPLIFAFVIAEFLVAVAEFPTVWAVLFHGTAASRAWGARIYERGEVFLEFFTFVVVIGLISRASASLRSSSLMRAGCVLGALLFVGISFRLHYDPGVKTGMWMALWTRDLNVGTSILDLALWALLMEQRKKDNRLLLLSGALGIQFAGAAIGHSLRSMSTHYNAWPGIVGGKVVVLASILRVYLWAQAFRAPQEARRGTAPDLPSGARG